MDFTSKDKDSKGKPKFFINKNKLKSSNATPKKALLQIITNLLSLLGIAISKTK